MVNPASNQLFTDITVEELATRMSTAAPQLIDVREPDEVAIAHLEGFINYPLSQYANWAEPIKTQLDPQAETIVLCHHGMRSAHMCQWLREQGFTQVKNVAGGIDAYSARIDPTIPRY